jgi:uncharacterized phage-associated protein
MLLDFDIQKTLSAIAFLIQREGGELDMFLALKMLYLADKEALIHWGKTITGDSFASLPKGPVLSRTYDLFKGAGPKKEQEQWNSCFSERVNQAIHLLKDVDTGLLSEREMETLESARIRIHEVAPWDVADWLHKTCPEWQDPKDSSTPIDPSTILRNAGKSEEEIRLIEESNDSFRLAKTILGGR